MTTKSSTDKKRSFAEIRAMATRVRRSVTVCLAGDLNFRLQELRQELADEKKRPRESLGDGGREAEIQFQIDTLTEQGHAAEAEFVLEALPAKTFRDLMDRHPGRDGRNEAWNLETFPVALVSACLVDPKLTEAEVAELVDDVLNDGQWGQIFDTAWNANRGTVDLGPTSPASRAQQDSATN